MSYKETFKVKNGELLFDYDVYTCDYSGEEIEESWPHFSIADKDVHLNYGAIYSLFKIMIKDGYHGIPYELVLSELKRELDNRNTKKKPKGKFIYLLYSEYGYKIGKTNCIKTRSQIFKVNLPFYTEIVNHFKVDDHNLTEKLLHNHFSEKRLNGEWFNLSQEDVENFEITIKSLKQ